MSAQSSALLAVTGLAKAFGGRRALSDISFSVAAGEIVGCVGPNGAGKSTTLRIVCGLLRPDAGCVRLDRWELGRHPQEFRSLLGVLIEGPGYYPGLSAFEHLAYLARVRRCFSRERIVAALEEAGLAPLSRKRVAQFSLGMKQRLAIAMAILHEPRLLVLDEPMNGLDPVGMASLREFLRRLAAERGVSTLISSHLLNEVEQICDRVLFIRDGRLLGEATLTRGGLAEIGAVLLRTGDDARAGELLRDGRVACEVSQGPDGLECRMAVVDVPRIAPLLVGAGIEIREITPRGRGLEALYLSHYGSGRAGGIE